MLGEAIAERGERKAVAEPTLEGPTDEEPEP
jgi:hypothetical protein